MEPSDFHCMRCGDLLELRLDRRLPTQAELFGSNSNPGIWRFGRALPLGRSVSPISLCEGGSPLIRSSKLGPAIGLSELYIKNEGQNPTGSFKDRGMTVAVTRAIERHAKVLLCASTGNTSASLAAYAAKAKGIRAAVLVPAGNVATGKLVQAVAYGARILRVRGNFDRALEMVTEAVRRDPSLYLVNSINPFRVEGQKTVAYEIFEQLGLVVPDYVVLPVGNAGNISAVWKGFTELKSWGISNKLPKLIGVQAKGAAPIAEAVKEGMNSVKAWKKPKTVASAIKIGNPVSWKKAMRAIQDSGGTSLAVPDSEILRARDDLAAKEGVFVEAASAAPVAALEHLRKVLAPRSTVVCIATGNGLKDQESVKVDLVSSPQFSDETGLLKFLKE